MDGESGDGALFTRVAVPGWFFSGRNGVSLVETVAVVRMQLSVGVGNTNK